jgi:hypothetical protein
MAQRLKMLWASYRQDVIPKDAHLVQIQESRRAFMAGNVSEGDDVQQSDMDLMASIDAELKQFNRDIQEGRA